MMDKINYKEYDRLVLYVKRDKVEEIIASYNTLSWNLVQQTDNNRYEDIVDLVFIRAHKIQNKDELQIQQVYLEETLNSLGKIQKEKHQKTTGLGLSFGSLSLAGIVLGVLGIVGTIKMAFWFAILLAALGGLSAILEISLLPLLFKKEKRIFDKEIEKLNKNINT